MMNGTSAKYKIMNHGKTLNETTQTQHKRNLTKIELTLLLYQ